MAGYDDAGPHLYQARAVRGSSRRRANTLQAAAAARVRNRRARAPQVDPSGSYFAWKASAIGKNMTNAKTFLEKRYSDDMELEARAARMRALLALQRC